MTGQTQIVGRLVLDDAVVAGRIVVEDGLIAAVEPATRPAGGERAVIAPGFVDVHVHGWGGHDAMGDARGARRHGPRRCSGMA